ncbi:hypothetical protein A9Q91_04820 [Candidatus Gracilibacteria bacterium 28_42_T64]|nr:hypothetical protein A9Q91_04820 [Candidatus Gracilibacteria bacterium 28_42_T64]
MTLTAQAQGSLSEPTPINFLPNKIIISTGPVINGKELTEKGWAILRVLTHNLDKDERGSIQALQKLITNLEPTIQRGEGQNGCNIEYLQEEIDTVKVAKYWIKELEKRERNKLAYNKGREVISFVASGVFHILNSVQKK